MSSGPQVYRKVEGVIHRVIGDEHVLIPIRQNLGDLQNVFALNDTAAFIFDQVDGVRDSTQVCALLAEQCSVPAAHIEEEVLGCMAELAGLGLIRSAVDPNLPSQEH